MAGGNSHEAAVAAERFAAAHAALKADSSVQFTLQPAPLPAPPPQWLIDFFRWVGRLLAPIGRFLRWIGSFFPDAPYARILLWSVLAVIAALVLWMIWQRVRHGEWRLPRRRSKASTAPVDPAEEQWTPDAAPVRAWLNEADRLAAEGRYAEAVRHLLFRSIEDIAKRRPRLVRPALTSRELADAEVIPASARQLFAGIARLVERSLFGGRPVGADDWQAARAAYTDLALPGTWRV